MFRALHRLSARSTFKSAMRRFASVTGVYHEMHLTGTEALRGAASCRPAPVRSGWSFFNSSYLPWLGYFDQLYKSDCLRPLRRCPVRQARLAKPEPDQDGQGAALAHRPRARRTARTAQQPRRAHRHAPALGAQASAGASGSTTRRRPHSRVRRASSPCSRRPWTHLTRSQPRRPRGALRGLLGLTRRHPLEPELDDVPGQKTGAAHRHLPGPRRGPVSRPGMRASDYLDETQFAAQRHPGSSIITTGIPCTRSSTGSSCRICPWWTCS